MVEDKKQIQIQKEGFETYVAEDKNQIHRKEDEKYREGFETTYQECVPLTTEEGEDIQEFSVTRALDASIVEDAQSMFMYWLIFLVCGVFCSTVFPVLTIYAVKQDFKDRGMFFRLFLTITYIAIFVASFYFLSNITGNTKLLKKVGLKVQKQTKIMLGMFLMASAFFIYASVTFSKVSGLYISEDLNFAEYFNCDSAFTYIDIFGLLLDSTDANVAEPTDAE